MNLDEQIQSLIDHAPQDGTTPTLVEAIAPVLKLFARRLQHPQYYIVQTLSNEWVFTTLENRAQPDMQKQVIYAFPTLKDVATGSYAAQDPQMIALPVPVTHILFQMLAIEAIDSTIFFEVPGNLAAGTEIQRQEISEQIQFHLREQQAVSQPTIPPDLA